jgi:hypothetical protein
MTQITLNASNPWLPEHPSFNNLPPERISRYRIARSRAL